jgi:hypothetical protein
MDWKRKLTSRKFWMALSTFVSMLLIYFGKSESEAAQVVALIMAGGTVVAYIIGEGLIDAKSKSDKSEEENKA